MFEVPQRVGDTPGGVRYPPGRQADDGEGFFRRTRLDGFRGPSAKLHATSRSAATAWRLEPGVRSELRDLPRERAYTRALPPKACGQRVRTPHHQPVLEPEIEHDLLAVDGAVAHEFLESQVEVPLPAQGRKDATLGGANLLPHGGVAEAPFDFLVDRVRLAVE